MVAKFLCGFVAASLLVVMPVAIFWAIGAAQETLTTLLWRRTRLYMQSASMVACTIVTAVVAGFVGWFAMIILAVYSK